MTETELENWRGLLAFLPALRNRTPDFWRVGVWGDMTSVVSTETAKSLFKYIYEHDLLLKDFDWMAWQHEALAYLDYRLRLETADLATIQKLLTAHIRADRFSEGHYDAILENGFLRDLLERLAVVL